MDLPNLAALFSGVRWIGDDCFTAQCPLHDAGAALMVRQFSLGGVMMRCPEGCQVPAILAKLKLSPSDLSNGNQNGASAQPEATPPAISNSQAEEGRRLDELLKWKNRIEILSTHLFRADPEYQKGYLTWDLIAEPCARDIEIAIQRMPEYLAPAWLSASETNEEAQACAQRAWERFQATERNDLVIANGYPASSVIQQIELDRNPIDAYEAYRIIQADHRDYSVEGLIREGCDMVLTALMGSGKTTLSMNFTRGWALGEAVLGRRCKQSRTLVVVSPKEWEAWADTIGFWELRECIYLIESHKTHFESGGAEQAAWFETTMKKLDCRTFVLDTMFDFFGMPPNTRGDSNRIAMNEQSPLLDVVRRNNWSGIVTGHAPKSEAQALVPRDPEEAFAGHTAWTAQHRMRAVIRRKAKQVNAFVTGRGGFGDNGFLEEQVLRFDPETRLVSIGGNFGDHLGETALPSVLEALAGGGWMSRSDLMQQTGKNKSWIYAAIKYGTKQHTIKWNRKGSRGAKYALPDEPDEQGSLGI